MGRLSEHHQPKAGVTGKCSVPMWEGGCPSGFCDRPAYGEQYAEGTNHAPPWWSPRDRNGYLIDPHNRKPFASGLCCDAHGGPGENDVRFVRDGTTDGFNPMWCAFMPGFENLQESEAGFGETQPIAEAQLKAAIAKALGSHPLTRMVAIDEEIEATHPGWMSGKAGAA